MWPPDPQALRRKEEWLKEVQRTVPSETKPMIVKVQYELHNPEVERMRKFFNGPALEYYIIQNSDMTHGTPDPETKKKWREQILDDLLGYDLQLINRTVRQRKSTSDFTSTQRWHDFLELFRETHFEQAGYEFPDSEQFWEIAKKHGYEQAKKIAIEQLQKRMLAKL